MTLGLPLSPHDPLQAIGMTAHKTLALRYELGELPHLALVATVHALATQAFYRLTKVHCLGLRLVSIDMVPGDGLDGNPAAKAMDDRQAQWAAPARHPADLWTFVAALYGDDLMQLLAHRTAMTLDAAKQPHIRRVQGADAIDAIAADFGFDMADYWQPTVTSYFRRGARAQILATVSGGIGPDAARRIESRF